MRVFPVLDLLDGQVVRGVAGQRETYRPLETRLVASTCPLTIARALRTEFGLSNLYVADLDAILRRSPNLSIFMRLANDGFTLMVDAGLRRSDDADPLVNAGVSQIVAGLETLEGPAHLATLCSRWGPERVVFSLDLREGRPVAQPAAGFADDPLAIADQAVEAGMRQIIVLDLAQVGTGSGITTLPLCQQIRKKSPGVSVITGGGVRSANDLDTLRDAGIDGALVASAFHDGRLDRQSVARFDQATL